MYLISNSLQDLKKKEKRRRKKQKKRKKKSINLILKYSSTHYPLPPSNTHTYLQAAHPHTLSPVLHSPQIWAHRCDSSGKMRARHWDFGALRVNKYSAQNSRRVSAILFSQEQWSKRLHDWVWTKTFKISNGWWRISNGWWRKVSDAI